MLNRKINKNIIKFLTTIIISMLIFSQGIVIANEPSKPIITEIIDNSDDCDSVEVFVDEIISPPNFAEKGNHFITANFTNVIGININGLYDNFSFLSMNIVSRTYIEVLCSSFRVGEA